MRSLLIQLENNEAVLMMYIANELPADDRAEVEEMLSHDETMRGQLSELRQTYAAIDAAVGLADAHTPLPSSFSAARKFGEEVRGRIKPPTKKSLDEKVDASRRRLKMVMYPLVAAAAVALGMALWWKSASDEITKPAETRSQYVNGSGYGPGEGVGDATRLRMTQVMAMWDSPENPDLTDAQLQLSMLDYLKDSDTLQ